MKLETEIEWTAKQSTSYLQLLMLELEREQKNHNRNNSERIERVRALIANRGRS